MPTTEPGPSNQRPATRWTPLERSILPSLAVTAVVLIGILLLARVRLPPMPFSLVIVLGLWLICFVGVFFYQARRLRGRL